MLNITGEINVIKYEGGMTTTSIPTNKYDKEKKEGVKDKDGNPKKIFREIPVLFVGDAREISNCYNRTRVRIDNAWLSFSIDKDNKTQWKITCNKAEVLQEGEGFKKPYTPPEEREKNKKKSADEIIEPFSIGDPDELPF